MFFSALHDKHSETDEKSSYRTDSSIFFLHVPPVSVAENSKCKRQQIHCAFSNVFLSGENCTWSLSFLLITESVSLNTSSQTTSLTASVFSTV